MFIRLNRHHSRTLPKYTHIFSNVSKDNYTIHLIRKGILQFRIFFKVFVQETRTNIFVFRLITSHLTDGNCYLKCPETLFVVCLHFIAIIYQFSSIYCLILKFHILAGHSLVNLLRD